MQSDVSHLSKKHNLSINIYAMQFRTQRLQYPLSGRVAFALGFDSWGELVSGRTAYRGKAPERNIDGAFGTFLGDHSHHRIAVSDRKQLKGTL